MKKWLIIISFIATSSFMYGCNNEEVTIEEVKKEIEKEIPEDVLNDTESAENIDTKHVEENGSSLMWSDADIIKYLNMPVNEITNLEGHEIDHRGSLIIFEIYNPFPSIQPENTPYIIICRSWAEESEYTPLYISIDYDVRNEYILRLDLDNEMDFSAIMDVMGSAKILESYIREEPDVEVNYNEARKNYKLEYVRGDLEYAFIANNIEGKNYSFYIGLPFEKEDFQTEYVGNKDIDNSSISDSNVQDRLTKREALDILYDHLYKDSEQILESEFYDTEYFWGYEYLHSRQDEILDSLFLKDAGRSTDGCYQIFRLGKQFCDSSNEYKKKQTINFYAVNRETGEIVVERIYGEDGLYEIAEDYKNKVWDKSE